MAEASAQGTVGDQIASWAGLRLDEMGGAGVGKIEGGFVDAQSGELVWLLARLGRFGHHTFVPGRDAVEGVGRVWVPYSRDQIRKAPKADSSAPLTAAAERALLEHYGIAGGAGRAAQIAANGDDDVTAERLQGGG
jgi:hypothetical protein